MDGIDTTIRIRNLNDAVGAFVGNTYSSVQIGIYNPSTSTQGVLPPGVKRSFFGFNYNGVIGSLANTFPANIPNASSFRNILDDGRGNMSIAGVITGNGASLTSLNPTNISTGTAMINITGNSATATTAATVTGNISDSHLSPNVALLNASNTFAGAVTATNANNLINGTVSGNISGTFTGSGVGLTNLSATAITGGVNTNLLIDGHTFYITNGIIMAVQ